MPPPKDPFKYEESLRKMSEARKKLFEDPIKGETTRRRISEALKKRFEDPIKGEENRRKKSDAAKQRAPPSEATRRKMSESHKNPSEVTRQKLSEAGKKRYEDPEAHLKQSKAMKGEKNPNYGKKLSEEHRQKISEAGKLRTPPSKETRQKLSDAMKKRYEDPEVGRKQSEAQKGEKNPNYGKKLSEEQRQKISERQTGKHYSIETRMKHSVARTGEKHTEETRKKMSEASKLREPPSEETRRRMSEWQMGEKSPTWKGGISFLPYCQKFNEEFKERVRAFFDHQCIECGTPQKGKKLGIHHVNFDKQSCCNDTVPLFVPLCSSCHAKTNHNREYWEQHFTEMINKYYGGKCYFLKEEMTAIKREKHQ